MNVHAQSYQPTPLKKWLLAARPKTLTVAFGPVLVGSALAARAGSYRWSILIFALLASLAIQVGTNLHNDYADFARGADGNQRLGPQRAAASGWLAPADLKRAVALCFIVALGCGIPIVLRGGLPLLIVGLVSFAAGLMYTGGPFPWAYHGLGELFVFIFFGIVAVSGTYFAHSLELPTTVLLYSLPVGALASAILVVNNLRDREQDEKARKRTLMVRFGDGFGKGLYLALMGLAFVVVAALALSLGQPALFAPWLTLPYAWSLLKRLLGVRGKKLNAVLAETARLGLAFNVLLSLGVLL